MADKKEIVLPAEYDGQVIDSDEYFAKSRQKAIENAKTRTSSYAKPSWWKDDPTQFNNGWEDCISTATSNYGEGSVVFGNQTFAANPDKYGFRKLEPDEKYEAGDIIQYAWNGTRPRHAVILTGFDKDGKNRVAYSNGSGNYHQDNADIWIDPNGYDATPTYYRYIGTPAERAAIEQHNEAVRAANAASAQQINTPIQTLPTKTIEPESALENLANKRQQERMTEF